MCLVNVDVATHQYSCVCELYLFGAGDVGLGLGVFSDTVYLVTLFLDHRNQLLIGLFYGIPSYPGDFPNFLSNPGFEFSIDFADFLE